jgi:copper chaperone CopZ
MPANVSTSINLAGLHCDACPRLIEKRLKKIQGVQEVRVAMTGATEITADRRLDPGEIGHALTGTPYRIV